MTASRSRKGRRVPGATPRIACVGAGAWGRKLCRSFDELDALAWVCDVDPGARDAAAKTWPEARVAAGLATALDDVDGVVIATPADTHGRLAAEALRAGKDVFVEKPLCLSAAEARELVALAEARGRVLMVGHLLWYHPAVLALQELVDRGALGRIRYVYSNRLNLGHIRREEGALFSLAPHDVSLLIGLLGELPDRVEASGGRLLQGDVSDLVVATLGFPSGVKAHLFVSWLHPVREHRVVVVGERRMAVLDDRGRGGVSLDLHPYRIDWRGRLPRPEREEAERVAFEPGEPLRLECEHFLDRMADRGRPRTDGHEALRVLEVLEACERKVAAGQGGAGARPPAPEGFVHPSSHVDEDVAIGEGTRVWHFCHLLPGTRLGRDCSLGQNVVVGPRVRMGDGVKIQNNVTLPEGVTLEDHVFCGPSVVFTNVRVPRSEIPRMHELAPTLVRRGASLGGNATLRCGVTVGRYALVGAGAVVLEDVPDHALVVGNPARPIGWVCRCGGRVEGVDAVDGAEASGAGACRDCDERYEITPEGLAPLAPGAGPR